MAARFGKELTELVSRLITRFKQISVLLKDPGRRWYVIIPSLVILALAGGAIYYYNTVYLPSKKSSQSTPQTAVARRGDIILSASGTGTLQAANQVDLVFKSTGKLSKLNVTVGQQVKEGDLLAELDNTSQELQYEQAKQNLDSLTSVSAIGSAQQSMAAAAKKLQSAELQLEYLISPDVYYWENEITKDDEAVKRAQAVANATPSDQAAQEKLKKAKDLVGFVQDKLKDAQKNYHDYVLDNFTVQKFDRSTDTVDTEVLAPTAEEIIKARQDVTIAKGTLADAQNLYAALTGGNVPSDASGSGLVALEQAKLDLQTAQDNLQATQIFAPFSGTIVSVSAQLGPVSAIATPVGSTINNPVRSTSILTLADMSKLYLETYVDESDYDKFKVGNTANIVFDALPDQTFTGKVVEVDPALNTSSGSPVVSGLVQLDSPSAGLLLGMGASVNVIASQALNVVIVPLTALHEYAPGQYDVNVLENGKFTTVDVQVGLEDLVNAEIKSGLQPGDVVSTGLLGTVPQ